MPGADARAEQSAVQRTSSGVQILELLGDQYAQKSDNATADFVAHTMQLSAGPHQSSWASYGFNGLEQVDVPQSLTVNLGQDVPAVLWIGLADYAAGKWQWYQVAPDGNSVQLSIVDGARFINAAGSCYAALAVWDGEQATVSRLLLAYGHTSVQPGGWWPMFGYDRQHTSRSPNPGPDTPTLDWSLDLGHSCRGLTIASNGVIYSSTYNYEVAATSPTGRLLWAFRTQGNTSRQPAIGADGTVYFGSYDNYVYALNPDGSLRWQFDTGRFVNSDPVIGADGTVYCTGVGGLYAFKPGGALRWQYADGGEGLGCPAIAPDGTVYFASWDLYAVNPDGTRKWIAPHPIAANSSVCIGPDGTVYCSCYNDGVWDGVGDDDPNRELYAVSPAGELKWSLDLKCSTAPAIAEDGTLYFMDQQIVYAINPDGTTKWTYPGVVYTGEGRLAVDGNGTLYIGLGDYDHADATVLALNPDGSVKWSRDIAGNPWESGVTYPVIGPDNTLVVAAKSGMLLAFGAL